MVIDHSKGRRNPSRSGSVPARRALPALLAALLVFAGGTRARPAHADDAFTIIAGTGAAGYSGDQGPATLAMLNTPSGVATDAQGDVFIADSYNHRIRKIDPNGTITTIAGTAMPGPPSPGDGGPAASAALNYPTGIAVDAAGRIYFSDTNNYVVRKISGGIITNFAGDGSKGAMGDNAPATTVELNSPGGVAVDAAGSVYLADVGNNRIRKIDPSGKITTFAGTGAKGFSGDGGPAVNAMLKKPANVALDAAGNVYIADTNNARVRKVDSSGTITTVAGSGNPLGAPGDGGLATDAALLYPVGLVVDSTGNLYIGDALRNDIRKVDTKGIITTLTVPTKSPVGLAIDHSNHLLVADGFGSVVYSVALAGGTPPGGGTVNPTAVGDINGDGKITVDDAILVLHYLVGDLKLNAEQKAAADIDHDGKVNILDVIAILKKSVGIM